MEKRCCGEEMEKREKKLLITMESTKTLKRRRCNEEEDERVAVGFSLLKVLPQEILIKIACCVNHQDLRQLIRVSKAIQEAAIIAKESHFDRTPSETIRCNSDEAPPAPKRLRRNWVRIGKGIPRVPLFVDEEGEEQRCYEITGRSV